MNPGFTKELAERLYKTLVSFGNTLQSDYEDQSYMPLVAKAWKEVGLRQKKRPRHEVLREVYVELIESVLNDAIQASKRPGASR